MSTSRQKRQANGVNATIVCVPKKLGIPVLGEGECRGAATPLNIQPDAGCAGITGAQNQMCPVSNIGKPSP